MYIGLLLLIFLLDCMTFVRFYPNCSYVVTQHAGDFNLDVLKESAAKDQYCNVLCDFQLTQLVASPYICITGDMDYMLVSSYGYTVYI